MQEEVSKKLQEAVRYLKSKGIIKRDKDIADRMRMSPPTVSQYVSGQKIPSYAFIAKFEAEFDINIDKIKPAMPDENKVIKLLKLIAAKVGVPESEVKKALK